MNALLEKLSIIIASLWVGGLWAMLMVTTILFNKIPSTYIAGAIVIDMFYFMNLFGIASSIILLSIGFRANGISYLKKIICWLLVTLMIIIVISYFGINPLLESIKIEALPKEVMESVFAERFSTWHGIASVAYLIECFLGIFLLLKIR